MVKHSGERGGFTLVEISVAVGLVCLLTAILFPVIGRSRQANRRTNCASNLQQIYLATKLYYEDQRAYPASLGLLMPTLTTTTTTTTSTAGTNGPTAGNDQPTQFHASPPAADDSSVTTTTTKTTQQYGYIKDAGILRCPSDSTQTVGFYSSYGSVATAVGIATSSVWNYNGYDTRGYDSGMLTVPPARYSLANRFAPPQTIITHCVYHRTTTSNLKDPGQLYATGQEAAGKGASDILLRVDGSAKLIDVSGFVTAPNKWQTQN